MIKELKDAKDPNATLDYFVDWLQWLGGDTITASTWTVPKGLKRGTDSFNDSKATIWLSGGQPGAKYTLTNRITTAAGRIADCSFVLAVAEK